ncbi:MAG: mannose-1-phosphate guanylyltransferase/mannose-6-phosphate isomerase [Acidovorax sp.]|uniref:mannose-1-phosphate guanylyltransferase/mannose-6-phosphate isomerase n=1 Tax=Acidovorax sp. TaxID=1872122 RepID=UPI0039E2B09A
MLIPVVLSGGAGTRLWPASREGHPKPFMQLADGESLLLKTYRRASEVAAGGEIVTVTNRDYYFMSKDELALLGGGERGTFLLEPTGRNTAPAVALAARMVAARYGRDAVMLVLAADHLIQNQRGFVDTVAIAQGLAQQGRLVTFGIVPTAPETGFGYIETQEGEASDGGKRVLRFVEKPSADKAREYLASGRFLWNSGMFCFQAGVILDELARHAPDVSAAVEACWSALGAAEGEMIELPAQSFSQVPDISIDYAVMERSSNVAVVPTDIGWSDIGSWVAVSQLTQPDGDGNRAACDSAVFVDSHDVFVRSEGRVVATVGVRDLMIIDTPDALLVADPARAQDVKQVVARLKKQGHEAYKLHRTVSRPWGTYTVLEEGARFKIKRIEVKPGASLSLQMHHHRSEHWIVVSGMAKVVNGDKEFFVRANESTYIPAGHQHRLENPGVLDLVMIEVQSGEYLGEDDIVRFQDIYGRA